MWNAVQVGQIERILQNVLSFFFLDFLIMFSHALYLILKFLTLFIEKILLNLELLIIVLKRLFIKVFKLLNFFFVKSLNLSELNKIYITCMKDLWAFSFSFGIWSQSQLHIIWSVDVDWSHFSTREEFRVVLNWNEFKRLFVPSWWVSTLSPRASNLLIL